MKIAVVGNFHDEISPSVPSGIEVFIYNLVSSMAKSNIITSIDVYGVGMNHFTDDKIHFISAIPSKISEFLSSNQYLKTTNNKGETLEAKLRIGLTLNTFSEICEKKYDIIHDNSTSAVFISLGHLLKTPIVTTLHTVINTAGILVPYSLNMLEKNKKLAFIAISEYQKKYVTDHGIKMNIIKTIPHGIDINSFEFSDSKISNYGFWIGRVSRFDKKGLKEAILASKKTQKRLEAIVNIDDPEFYIKEITPLLTDDIGTYIHNEVKEKKQVFFRDAKYLLYPLMWEEPFGLIFIESMATGTPVIAYARGAVSEIIKDGETGFIVNPSEKDIRGNWIIKKTGIEGLCEAIEKIHSLSEKKYQEMRKACRDHVEKNFTLEKMSNQYLQTYKELI